MTNNKAAWSDVWGGIAIGAFIGFSHIGELVDQYVSYICISHPHKEAYRIHNTALICRRGKEQDVMADNLTHLSFWNSIEFLSK